jgi:long-chain acyl-CoA synthetase
MVRILTPVHPAEIPELDAADALCTNSFPIPPPTLLFIRPGHLQALTSSILEQAQKSLLLHPFAWRHKLAGVREGFMTKDSIWDRLLFDGARAKVIGEGAGTIRGIVVSGCGSLVFLKI